ncbi:ATPase [Vibrio lamellibrachiae]|uniref:BadF/BadG/BcrA/BcrD ATPase family protein n=1 Tax=Vibrio lamellibrachiae TaxID=2910253 RepID=UPI003D0B9920
MITHILSIDGGGTKTAIRLGRISPVAEKIDELIVPSSSLTLYGKQGIDLLVNNINHTLEKHQISSQQCYVVIGVAGAGNEHLKAILNKALGHYPHRYVTSDAEISVYGANLGKAVNCIAIGTGSVALQLDDNQHTHQYGGWGFPIGDEAGGAWLGFQAVQETLRSIDTRSTSQLTTYIMSAIGSERSQILNWVKNANATSYAYFAREITNLVGHCPTALKIANSGIVHVEQLTRICSSQNTLPIAFLGSLGKYYQDRLSSDIQSRCIPVQGNALDGADVIASNRIQAFSLGEIK